MKKRRRLVWIPLVTLGLILLVPACIVTPAVRQIVRDRELLAAIRANDASAVTALLNAGANANTRDLPHDTTPFWQQVLNRLRGVPAPPGEAALLVHLARVPDRAHPGGVWIGRPENTTLTRALLDHHADPNARGAEYNDTPLMRAVTQEKDSTIRLLLQRGADLNLRDFQGTDALHCAVELGSVERVRLLLDSGADVNSRDNLQNVPLMNAVSAQDIPIVRLLIARGADVNARDSAEDPVLTYAIRVHSHPLIALLKAAGARD